MAGPVRRVMQLHAVEWRGYALAATTLPAINWQRGRDPCFGVDCSLNMVTPHLPGAVGRCMLPYPLITSRPHASTP